MDSFNTSFLVVIIRVLIVDTGTGRKEVSYKIQASNVIIHYFNNTADNFAYVITNYLLFIHFTIL